MLAKVEAALAVLMLACALGLGWWAESTRAENKRLHEAVLSLTDDLNASRALRAADQAVASRYAKSVAIMTTTQRITDGKLQAALSANASWAGENVPPDVARALGMPEPTPAR